MKDNKTRPRGCESARVQSVIVTKSLRGQGTDDDPVRIIIQYWNFNGTLLAENDPCINKRKDD